MSSDAWQVFLIGLDPAKVAREWAPPLEQVIGERPTLDPKARERVAEVQEWSEVMRADRRLQAALADVERVAARRDAEARELRAFQMNQNKYRKAA